MAAANNNNLVDTHPLSSEESSDEEDQPAFLNLPVNRGFNNLFGHFNDLFELDEVEEDSLLWL